MHTLLSFVMAAAQAAAQTAAQTAPVPAVHITPAEIAAVLETAIAKSAVDQPIKVVDVHGGRALVAMLHRDRAETGALIHERVTETYYILHGSGTMVTGGSLGDPKPSDLTRVGAGPSISGTRQGGEKRKVGPGDVIIVPAGTPHSFDQLDSPISYLVFRFDPLK
jgi:mannose-6-phosphate isomerase-like protein (cupin superfamily)